MTIKIKIKDQEYTIKEAKELYNELHKMFGKDQFAPITIPDLPPRPWYREDSGKAPWEPPCEITC